MKRNDSTASHCTIRLEMPWSYTLKIRVGCIIGPWMVLNSPRGALTIFSFFAPSAPSQWML